MGDLLHICEQCRRARGAQKIEFPSGAVMWMCKSCEHAGWEEFTE